MLRIRLFAAAKRNVGCLRIAPRSEMRTFKFGPYLGFKPSLFLNNNTMACFSTPGEKEEQTGNQALAEEVEDDNPMLDFWKIKSQSM